MLAGIAEGLSDRGSAKDLLPDNVSWVDVHDEADDPLQVIYMASFEKLGSKYVQYVLQKDLASRKLYVKSKEIVYKVSKPLYIPFLGSANVAKHVPLSMVIDVIVEQGWLQSVYGLHTFRIESIAHGKAAPVDDFQGDCGLSFKGYTRFWQKLECNCWR